MQLSFAFSVATILSITAQLSLAVPLEGDPSGLSMFTRRTEGMVIR
jgi:hypothetical protein